jgi:hypothetical protein
MDFDADFATALADHRAGLLDAAERGYRALVESVEHAPALHNLALILERKGRIGEATEALARAAAAEPARPQRLLALADHLRMSRDFDAAEPLYRQILTTAPGYDEAAHELGLLLLASGRHAEGWTLNARRPARLRFLENPLNFPEWRGEPLAGKRLFIWREQGLGDQIMMARFLPRLGAAHITYAGPPALRRLIERPGLEFITGVSGDLVIPNHDYWTLPLSLPGGLGASEQNLPAQPYLSGRATDRRGRIGVVWRGEPGNPNDRYRSLPPDGAAKLLALPGAISLDPADSGAADLQATADIIAGLDLVITVDTAVAHLAGAMGARVWVLLARRATDWQWPREGVSPWYPSARLFVQPTAGDWASVIETVLDEV